MFQTFETIGLVINKVIHYVLVDSAIILLDGTISLYLK